MRKFKKVQTMSVREFMGGEREPEAWSVKVARHLEEYGLVYKIVGATVVILVAGGGFDYAFAESSMSKPSVDLTMRSFYSELVGIGKWVIIFKGGIEILKSVGEGDFGNAKKTFFSYLMVYLFLLGFPYGMDKVDEIFSNLKA